jgi:hypothetical protein
MLSSSVRRSSRYSLPTALVPELEPCSPSRTPVAAQNSIWHIVHGVYMPTAAWTNEAPFWG